MLYVFTGELPLAHDAQCSALCKLVSVDPGSHQQASSPCCLSVSDDSDTHSWAAHCPQCSIY